MPKELHGEWCTRDDNYFRLTKCKDEPDGIDTFARRIDRTSNGTQHTMCKPLDVRKQDNTWIIKEHCGAKTWTTHYARRGAYLYITEK